ncbi:MAG TPA: helix-turn-helix transcriptional regulator [Enterococcus sp.]|nr:helix-turn-helix transcriptional regulator [Enterococcus sp.]
MNKLRELREEKGYSLRELGEKIGMSASVIGNYERGDREPKLEVWEKLADYFEVSVPYIMGVSDIKNELSSSLEFGNHFSTSVLAGIINKLENMDDEEEAEKISTAISEYLVTLTSSLSQKNSTEIESFKILSELIFSNNGLFGARLFFEQNGKSIKPASDFNFIKTYLEMTELITKELDKVFLNKLEQRQK